MRPVTSGPHKIRNRNRDITLGLGFAIMFCIAGVLNPVVAEILKARLGLPPWLYQLTVMHAVSFFTALVVGGTILDRRGMFLNPVGGWGGWVVGVGSAVALAGLHAGLRVAGGEAVAIAWVPAPMTTLGAVGGAIYLEIIYRGAVFGLMLNYLRRPAVAALVSTGLYLQAVWGSPWEALVVSGVGALTWCALTLRWFSLWPALVSHVGMVVLVENAFGPG